MSRFSFLLGGVALLPLLSFPVLSAQAQSYETLPPVEVEAEALLYYPGAQSLDPQARGEGIAHDGGSFLDQMPGVSAARMGGHGLEPVIRGQQQTQLNILLDGAYIHGGCPNRMDPSASFALVDSYDEITVLHGYQSVQYGPGGSGGTVLFDRTPRTYDSEKATWEARFEGGVESNGAGRSLLGDFSAGTKDVVVRSTISHAKSNNYKDGNGDEVRSSFETKALSFTPTWHVSDATDVTAGIEMTRTEDALFEGSGMDSPEDFSVTYRAEIDHEFESGSRVQKVTFSAYQTLVNHLMDNFTLRPLTAAMKMKTKSDSDTTGGKLVTEIDAGASPLLLGLDIQSNRRDALRYSGMAAAADATNPQSYMWPDATISQTGLFGEKEFDVASRTRLKLGGRYDYVRAEADAADELYDGTNSANALYLQHYGITAEDVSEHNVGGLARLEFDLNQSTMLFAGISRSVRTADATERYMAARAAPGSAWIGNPALKPEAHHQIDLGVMLDQPGWHFNANAYYDDVKDFIMRDIVRGQGDGVLATAPAGNTIYRNIDATLTGLELDGHYDFNDLWSMRGDATYTWGQNDEDDDALAQIPPLEGSLSLSYAPEGWALATRGNFALKQTRIDSDTSQRDAQKTPGYITVDLYGHYDISSQTRLHFGVDNIFDKTYAHHLNRSNAFDTTEIQVNEPGRSFYLRLSARF